MSREVRIKIIENLKWRLEKAIEEESNPCWICILEEEIKKHTDKLKE